jgi:hypothetical protein
VPPADGVRHPSRPRRPADRGAGRLTAGGGARRHADPPRRRERIAPLAR